jgi:hypothetical protein
VSAYLLALERRCRGTCSRGSVISHPPSLKVSPKNQILTFCHSVLTCPGYYKAKVIPVNGIRGQAR